MHDLSQLTAIIKTFQRPRALDRLVRSIRRRYPALAIAVADDGPVASPRDDVDYLRLPEDVGLSAGRNALVRHIRTPYLLLLDDDLELTAETPVERLLSLVQRGAVDVAAGDYRKCKRTLGIVRSRPQSFHGSFRFEHDELQLVSEPLAVCDGYQLCDFVHNFFVARTSDILALGGWDEELKLNEHIEFFVRARKRGLRVGYRGDVVARHWKETNADYAPFRQRNYTDMAAQKIGVRRVKRFDGQPIASGSSHQQQRPAAAATAAAGIGCADRAAEPANHQHVKRPASVRPQIAVILSTYQRPEHLRRSLVSLALQRGVEGQFEVVVTDDGSADHTEEVVRRFAKSANFPLMFTTHEHCGFRLSRCRNEGVLASTAPYLLFSDSDCIFPRDHLEQHLQARRASTARSGDCLHLDEASTARIDEAIVASAAFEAWICPKERQRIRRRWMKDRFYQTIRHSKKPKLVGCNIAVWRSDFERINGFDEQFIGWGCEDDDLADRLRRSSVRIASIHGFTEVFHMWHPPAPSRPVRWAEGANVDYLLREDKPVRCLHGLSAHEPATAGSGPSPAEPHRPPALRPAA